MTGRARRWWGLWAIVNAAVLVATLRQQLDLITAKCPGCPTVFRLTPTQVRELEAAGASLGSYRALVATIVVTFALAVGWLAWALVHRSGDDLAPIALGYLFTSVAAMRWTEDAAMLGTGWLSPVGRVMAVANYVAPVALFALFPDGRWRPRWSPLATGIVAVWAAVVYLTPLADDLAAGHEPISSIDAAVFLTGLVLVVVWQVGRFRASDSEIRRSIRWVIGAAVGALVVFAPVVLAVRLGTESDPRVQLAGVGLAVLALSAVLAAATAAILRHHLWDVDVIVSRVLVYGGLTAVVATGYVLLVWLASRPAVSYGAPVAIAGAIGIALALAPLQRRFQALATRLVFGQSPSTTALVTPLGEVDQLDPAGVLAATAEVIRGSLALPYVAFVVDLPDASADAIEASAGERPGEADLVVLSVEVGAARIGTLTVAIRRGQRRFTRQDRRVLAAVATQAGATAAMVRVATDLQHSRRALVTTREEERRRIRRDLHDGLGPTLAGVAHRLERVRTDLPRGSNANALVQIEADVRTALDEVRQLVRGLRPPVLDQLGVVGAIEVLAQDLGLDIDLEVSEAAASDLNAAVELAAYRIAAEALTNAHRHGRARRARVRLGFGVDELCLEIDDDGTGLRLPVAWGVGLRSMHERASELGGTCSVTPGIRGGATVSASLPLHSNGGR